MKLLYENSKYLAAFISVLTTAIFVGDSLTPLGVAGGVPYIAPVFLSYWFKDRRSIYAIAAICSGLTVLGFFLSPPNQHMWMVYTNRFLALFAIWTTAILLAQLKGNEWKLNDKRNKLLEEIVERQKAERDNIKSSSILSATLASTTDGILVLDNNNNIIRSNKKFQKMWRIPDSVLEDGDRLRAMQFVKEQLKNPEQFMAEASNNKYTDKKQDTLEFVDGRVFERYIYPQVIGGQSVGRVISFRDITERKQAEKALVESEVKYKHLVEGSPDLIYIFSSKRGGTYYSPRVEEVLGYPVSHLMENSFLWHDSIHPDDLPEVDKAIEDYFKGAGYAIEYRIKNSRGEWKWFFDRFIRKETWGDEIIIEGLATDITERKKAEEALQANMLHAEFRAELGLALTESGDLREILQKCCESMVENLDAAFSRIWTFNDKENMLELEASAGMYTHIDGGHSRVPLGKFKIGAIAKERKPHLTNAVIGDSRVNEQEWAKREGMVAFAGYPLVVDDELVGVMAMFARKRLTETTMQLLGSVANEIALGIERKQTEEELGKAHELLTKTFASLDEVVFVVALPSRKIISCNQAVKKIFGYSEEELIGKSTELIHVNHEMFVQFGEELHSSLKDKGVYKTEFKVKRKNGEVFPSDHTVTEIKDDTGQRVAVVSVMTDITERKRAEEERGKAHELLTKTFASLDEAVLVVNLASRKIVSCNRALENIFGYSQEELIGKTTEFLHISHEMFVRFGTQMGSALKEKGVFKTEFPLKRKNGAVFLSEHTVSIVKDDLNQRVDVVSVFRDITERKRAEELLKNRTVELEEANKKLDEFNYIVTHDLKEPLRTLSNYTGMLQKSAGDNLDQQDIQAIGFINDAAKRMRQMVNGLLHFSRVGKEEVRMEAVNLHDCMSKVAHNLETAVKETDGKLRWEKLPTVTGDPTMLTMVLQNLVHNAFKFRANRPPEVTVSSLCINDKCEITVADNGIGIDKEHFDRIFEPFKRLHSRSEYEGSGVGLAICRKVIDLHGGELTVESKKGIGSKFKLILNQSPASQTGEINRKDRENVKPGKRKFLHSSIG